MEKIMTKDKIQNANNLFSSVVCVYKLSVNSRVKQNSFLSKIPNNTDTSNSIDRQIFIIQ